MEGRNSINRYGVVDMQGLNSISRYGVVDMQGIRYAKGKKNPRRLGRGKTF
jgi:hypothetical protein